MKFHNHGLWLAFYAEITKEDLLEFFPVRNVNPAWIFILTLIIRIGKLLNTGKQDDELVGQSSLICDSRSETEWNAELVLILSKVIFFYTCHSWIVLLTGTILLGWAPGRIIKLYYSEPNWPPNM
jgi:hypothetical protein